MHLSLVLPIMLWCDPGTLAAFEGEEHQRISQVAFELAISNLEGQVVDSTRGQCVGAPWARMSSAYPTVDKAARQVLYFLQGQGESSLSFGKLVSSVDHIDDPNKLLKPDFKEGLGSERAKSLGCPVLWGGEEFQSEDDPANWICDSPKSLADINVNNIRQATSDSSNRISALHTNSSHFQDQLAYSIWEWFRRAREEASAAGVEEHAAAMRDPSGPHGEAVLEEDPGAQLDSSVARLEREIETLRESLTLLEEKKAPKKKPGSGSDRDPGVKPGDSSSAGVGDHPAAKPESSAGSVGLAAPTQDSKEADRRPPGAAAEQVALPSAYAPSLTGKDAATSAVESADDIVGTIKEQLGVLVAQLEDAKARAALDEGIKSQEFAATRRQQQHALYTALIEAAIAAHYIEDSFAPGHINTMREGRADYPANTLHDKYNFTGRCFAISKEERRRVDHFLGGLAEELAGNESLLRELELQGDEVKVLFAELSSQEDPIPSSGEGGDVARAPRCDERRGSFLFRGDGDLLTPASFGVKDSWCGTPKCIRESSRQRLLVTLVVARAIAELLEVYALGVLGEQSCPTPQLLSAYDWKRMKRIKKRSVLGDEVEMPTLVTAVGRFEETDKDTQRAATEKVAYGFMSLLEIGAATFLEGGRGSESGRGLVGFEWTPVWGPAGAAPTGSYTPRYHSFGWGLGGAYRFDEELAGVDATVRFYYQLPKIDMFFAVASRVSRLEWDGRHSTRVVPEFRAGRTFGGFLNIYLGAANDFRLTPDRRLDRTLSLTTGAQVGLPWWRIAHWAAGLGD